MDNGTIGTASVKITADISQLKQQIEEAKTATESLKGAGDNFKVTWMGEGAGSIQDYNNWLQKANKEWEEYEQKQENIAQSAEVVRERIQATTSALNEQANATKKSTENIQEADVVAKDFGDSIQGSFLRAKDTIEEASRTSQAALIGLATAMTVYGKSAISEYAKYNEDAAQTQEQLEKASTRLKLTIGQLLQPIAQVITGVMDWVSRNKEIVAGVATTVGLIAGTAGLIAVVKKLSGALTALKVAGGGVIGILSLIAGVAVGVISGVNGGFNEYNETLEEHNKELEDAKSRTDMLANAQRDYGQAISDMNERIKEARDGIAEAERSYAQSLKKILVNHEKTVDRLTQQIKDANSEYNRAVEERNATFALNQQKEEEAHADKVKELTNQINFLQRYNNKYNKEKLEALKFALAEENTRYQKQTDLMKDELETQNRNEKEKLDSRLKEFNSELEEEQAFLLKHRDTLNAVREVILEDEVEMLERSHKATLASYEKAIQDAMKSGASAGVKWAEAFNSAMTNKSTVDYIYKGIKGTLDKATYQVGKAISPSGQAFTGQTISSESLGRILFSQEGYATGGYTGQGSPNEVAGVVHKGEYVLPQEQVDQSTGQPKAMGNTFNINVSGVFATSAMERRKVAEEIMRAFQQTNNARLGA